MSNDVWGSLPDYSGRWAGSTDISVYPEFVDPLSEDNHLTADWDCIDARTTVDWLHVEHDGDIRLRLLVGHRRR